MKKTVKPGTLFDSVMVYESIRRKEAGGETSREVKERAAAKVAELFPNLEQIAAGIMEDIAPALDAITNARF